MLGLCGYFLFPKESRNSFDRPFLIICQLKIIVFGSYLPLMGKSRFSVQIRGSFASL